MGAARAMQATQAPGVTKVNTLGAAQGLGEHTYDMGLGVPKRAGRHWIDWECEGKMIWALEIEMEGRAGVYSPLCEDVIKGLRYY